MQAWHKTHTQSLGLQRAAGEYRRVGQATTRALPQADVCNAHRRVGLGCEQAGLDTESRFVHLPSVRARPRPRQLTWSTSANVGVLDSSQVCGGLGCGAGPSHVLNANGSSEPLVGRLDFRPEPARPARRHMHHVQPHTHLHTLTHIHARSHPHPQILPTPPLPARAHRRHARLCHGTGG